MVKKRVKRHELDREFVQAQYDAAIPDVGPSLESARGRPLNLDLLIMGALRAAAYGSIVAPRSLDIARHLKLASQASAAIYTIATVLPATVPLGEGDPVTYTTPPDSDTVEVSGWIEGFFLAALCRDVPSLSLLCAASVEPMRRSRSRHPEYRYPFMEALRAFWRGEGDCRGLALEAMRMTDPTRPDIYGKKYTLYIDVHLIRLLFLISANDPEVEDALFTALKDHKKYWSRKDLCLDTDGFLSIPLLGLAALAYDRGIRFEVESEYLPMWLVTGETFRGAEA